MFIWRPDAGLAVIGKALLAMAALLMASGCFSDHHPGDLVIRGGIAPGDTASQSVTYHWILPSGQSDPGYAEQFDFKGEVQVCFGPAGQPGCTTNVSKESWRSDTNGAPAEHLTLPASPVGRDMELTVSSAAAGTFVFDVFYHVD
jgi:hypothetical protein